MLNTKMYVLALAIALAAGAAVAAQTTPPDQSVAAATEKPKVAPAEMPGIDNYRGIKIGMSAKDVKDKINKKPTAEDKEGYYFELGDHESAQIALDADGKVRAISVIYGNGADDVPKYADVFGHDPESAPAENAALYNLVRYPSAGFWVAYNRSAGERPQVTLTIQKMERH